MKTQELAKLLRQIPEDLEVLMNLSGEFDVYDSIGITVETDMRTGTTVVIVTCDPMPNSTNARDYEPHPAYEGTINSWILD
jgi:hypothetical protein